MRAFVRFSLSHIGFPSLDRICMLDRSLAIGCSRSPEGDAGSRSSSSSSCELERTNVAGKLREVPAIRLSSGTRLILAPDHQEREVIGPRGAGGKSS